MNVQTIGRALTGTTFAQLNAQLRDGEVLVGLYDRIIFKQAPHLEEQWQFDDFEDQVRRLLINRLGFFAIPRAALDS